MLSRFERFTRDINVIDLNIHRLVADGMKRYGLKGVTAIYFTKLYRRPEGLSAAELGTECGRDKADVSRDMAKLEKAGLVTRRSAGGRGYRAPIVLTAEGRTLAQEIIQTAEAAVAYIGQGLSSGEREVFYGALDKITENLQALSEKGLAAAEDCGPEKGE